MTFFLKILNMDWVKISVVLFIYAIKCMEAANEIEEFSEFLYKTSQLDQILKKGNDFDDDADEPPSDNAWEVSGKFEGDLILNDRQRKLLIEDVAEGLSRNGLKDSTKKWPDNEVIYYVQKEHFTDDQMQAIESGIEDIARASCVKFRPYKRGDRDAVVIQGSRRGCFSQVGYQGGYQVLNLNGRHPVGRGCFRHGTVVHELLHTLGFYHMQSSPDRDEFIDVKWENIIQPARHNFRKYNSFSVTDFGVGYDYDSVLHYSRRAFSANGKDTLVPKQSGASIGQRIGLSDKDTQKLNKMYCDGGDNNSFDAEEDYITKPDQTKKRPKNKPFQGQGIGYNKGKVVVIKLPPARPTSMMSKISDIPIFHVFDYFSKTPQTVPSALFEGFGVGKEIDVEFSKKPVSLGPIVEKKDDNLNTKETKQLNSLPKHDESEHDRGMKTEFLATTEDDLDEAFERLGKIIKTHVYPSHLLDFSIYNPKELYKKYETNNEQNQPGNQHEEMVDERSSYNDGNNTADKQDTDKNVEKGYIDDDLNDLSEVNKKKNDDYDQSAEINHNNGTHNPSRESDEEIDDDARKADDYSGKLNYESPSSTQYVEPFETTKFFEKYIASINKNMDDPDSFSKHSVKNFDEPFYENVSNLHDEYKKILNDNRSKHSFLIKIPGITEQRNLEPSKPHKQVYKTFEQYVPIDKSYENLKNIDLR